MEEDASGDQDVDIANFFFVWEDGYQYKIEEKEIQGLTMAEEPPLGPDEVLLTPDEVAAVIGALVLSGYGELARQIKMPVGRAIDARNSAYKKLRD
jgi:hypothetical protein